MSLKTKDYVFVIIQFGLFLIYTLDVKLLSINYPSFVNLLGLIISFIGAIVIIVALLQLNKNLSPFPSPKSNSKLIKNGLYKYIRHPIYTGILFYAFGNALYTNSVFKIVIGTLLCLLFYYKSKYEELKLLDFFKDYDMYRKNTGRFLPPILNKRSPS